MCLLLQNNSAVESQKAVSVYFTSKQILPFGFSGQNGDPCTLLIAFIFFGDRSLFRRSIAPKVRCSEGPMFRRSVVPKVRCSEGSLLRRFVTQNGDPCTLLIAFIFFGDRSLFRRSIAPKARCSEGPMFRRSVVPKVRCSEGSLLRRFVTPKLGFIVPKTRFNIPKKNELTWKIIVFFCGFNLQNYLMFLDLLKGWGRIQDTIL